MKTMRLLVFAMLILIATVVPTFAQDQSEPTVVGGDEAMLREFIARMFGNYGAPGYTSSIWIGSLPDEELPFDLPLPADAVVIGTLVNGDPMGSYTQIIVDSSMSAQAVADFYAESLSGDAWSVPTNGGYRPGGFIELMTTYSQFCFNTDEALLEVNATERDNGTDIRYFLREPGDIYMCASQPASNPPIVDAYQMLPLIEVTDGVSFLAGSSGGGGGGMPGMQSASSTVTLLTELPIDVFAPALMNQLEAKNWDQVVFSVGEHFAMSTWTTTDKLGDTWGATFTITADPLASGQYLAFLTVQQQNER